MKHNIIPWIISGIVFLGVIIIGVKTMVCDSKERRKAKKEGRCCE